MSIACALAEAHHHSALKVGAEQHYAPRRQKTTSAGARPGVLKDPAPQGAVTVGYVAAPGPLLSTPSLADTAAEAVDARTVKFLLQKTLARKKKEEEEEERRKEVAKQQEEKYEAKMKLSSPCIQTNHHRQLLFLLRETLDGNSLEGLPVDLTNQDQPWLSTSRAQVRHTVWQNRLLSPLMSGVVARLTVDKFLDASFITQCWASQKKIVTSWAAGQLRAVTAMPALQATESLTDNGQ